jgi:hypothetical protein
MDLSLELEFLDEEQSATVMPSKTITPVRPFLLTETEPTQN